ncbi:hypothetical protein [Natrinema salifodinae]|uniref:Uncharacterized protein n=1 Tax=Natrinema salifodinae TaxID=1202768 RepID=A0A1I0N0N4_9EURY|nr:hypothetical protein [Natrinema salifodinae]SEV94606.1 hypothetical protein SAMN05216285_1216 [Natrinema salifodinae]
MIDDDEDSGREPWPDDIEGGWPNEPYADEDTVIGGYGEDEDGKEPWPDDVETDDE